MTRARDGTGPNLEQFRGPLRLLARVETGARLRGKVDVQGGGGGLAFQRLTFNFRNVGTVAAIGVQGDLLYNGQVIGGGNDARIGAVAPGANTAAISFDLKPRLLDAIFGEESGRASKPVQLHLQLGYCLPSGHVMRDHLDIEMVRVVGAINWTRLPGCGGKTIAGMRNYLRAD